MGTVHDALGHVHVHVHVLVHFSQNVSLFLFQESYLKQPFLFVFLFPS